MIRAGVLGAAGVLSSFAIVGGLDGPPTLPQQEETRGAAECDPLCLEVGRYGVRDEVVVDGREGDRLWQRRAAERFAHPEAVRYCAGLTLDGLDGWRLPSREELGSLRYRSGGLFGGGSSRHYCIPAIDQEAFPETPAAEFWTSVTLPDGTAWYIGFDDGRTHRDEQSDPLWVRCVHDAL